MQTSNVPTSIEPPSWRRLHVFAVLIGKACSAIPALLRPMHTTPMAGDDQVRVVAVIAVGGARADCNSGRLRLPQRQAVFSCAPAHMNSNHFSADESHDGLDQRKSSVEQSRGPNT